jgi:uncharacterized protein
MDESDLIYSKHCQTVSRNGKTVDVVIFSSGKNDWILEVVDEENNSAVWNDPFATDDEAFREFQRAMEEEAIESMIGLEN